MVKVVGVKFKTSGRVYYFDPLDLPFRAGDGVIVETSRGLEFGEATGEPTEVEESEIVAPLKPVLRIATDEDKRMRALYRSKEPEALAICAQKIEEHHLDMKLIDAEYIFNGSKIVFYFTADERIDFRDLVKDLAYSLRTRIELRQIGVRDEAKMLGGLGPCGRPVCCNAFLDDFRPVSIKMAKDQNLSLSPTKISGLCGRLMCCLQYEQNVYDAMKKVMPKVGKEINTVDGVGVVVENNAITERTRVRLTMEDGTIDVREYPYTHLGPVGEPLPEAALENAEKKQEDGTFSAPAQREFAGRGPRNRRGGKPEQANAKQGEQKTDKPQRSEQKQNPRRGEQGKKPEPAGDKPEKQGDQKPKQGEQRKGEQRQQRPTKQGEPKQKGEQKQPRQGEQKQPKQGEQKPSRQKPPKQTANETPSDAPAAQPAQANGEPTAAKKNNRRRRHRPKKPNGESAPKAEE